jgi:hypothetical protein
MIKTITALAWKGDGFPVVWGSPGRTTPQRWVANRIVEARDGAPGFNGLVEAWWRDQLEAEANAVLAPAGATVVFSALIDERRYQVLGNPKDGPLPNGYYKILSAYRLPGSVDGDDFWRYHTEVHGPDVVAAAGELAVGYALNRRIATLAGAPTFFALIELWWANSAAALDYPNRSSTYVTASGKPPMLDFRSRGAITDFSIVLEEEASHPSVVSGR